MIVFFMNSFSNCSLLWRKTQVVASQDLEGSKYAGLYCAQAHRQEIICDLFNLIKYLSALCAISFSSIQYVAVIVQ